MNTNECSSKYVPCSEFKHLGPRPAFPNIPHFILLYGHYSKSLSLPPLLSSLLNTLHPSLPHMPPCVRACACAHTHTFITQTSIVYVMVTTAAFTPFSCSAMYRELVNNICPFLELITMTGSTQKMQVNY